MLPTHSIAPPVVAGYELNPQRGWFGIILPDPTVNLVSNPSIELDTTGYFTVSSAVQTRVADFQRRGAWSLKVAPTAVASSGVYYSTVAVTAGQVYTFSLDFLGAGGVPYKIYFADVSGGALQLGTTFRATGEWQRVEVAWPEILTTSRRLYIVKANSSSTAPFYIDGLQVEAKAYDTTYADGDQTGYTPGFQDYYWSGTPHASPSYRLAESRAGGRIVSLDDYGFGVLAVTGLGAPSPDNVATPYGLLDGAYYQRTVVPPRQFALVGSVSASGVAQVQRFRAALVAGTRHDSVAPDQPIVLVYQRAEGQTLRGESLYIPCVYSGGLEGNLDNLYQERIALAFTMFTPYVTASGDAGELLDAQDTYGANVALYQTLDGDWRALGTGGPYLRRSVSSPQGVFLGFQNVAATTFTIYKFEPATGTLTSLGTSSSLATLYAMFVDSRGRLWVGGTFTSLGGVSCSNAAYYNFVTGVWVATGTPGFVVRDFTEVVVTLISNIIAGGENVAGTAGFVRYWFQNLPTTWTDIGGTINDSVYAVGVSQDPLFLTGSYVYAGGNFTTFNSIAISYLAKFLFDGAYTPAAAATGINDQVSEITNLPNGDILIGGECSAIGALAIRSIAAYNGQFWYAFGDGLGQALSDDCQSLAVAPDGTIYAVSPGLDRGGGNNAALSACGGVVWNGQRWTPISWQTSLNSPKNVTVYGPGRLILGFLTDNNLASGVIEAVNQGSARVFPIIRVRNSLAQQDTEYSLWYTLENMTTGARITFENLFIAGREVITLDTNPENPSLVSSYRGELPAQIAAGSDLGSFFLRPGSNKIAVFVSTYTGNNGLEVSAYWRERSYGIDVAAR